jgi:hypothetical protein
MNTFRQGMLGLGLMKARHVVCATITTIAGVVIASGLGGCQTMTHGTTQMVTINTDPPGAKAVVVGQPEQVTPAVFNLSRTRSTFVTLTLDGHKPKRVPIKAQLLPERVTPKGEFMSVLGSVVDTAAGGGWELTPGELTIVMEPLSGAPATQAVAQAAPAAPQSPTVTSKSTQPCLPPLPAVEMVHIKQAGAAATATATPSPSVQPPAPKSASIDVSAVEYRLKQLENLKQRGVITESEYIAMRREVLASVVAGTAGGLAAGGE